MYRTSKDSGTLLGNIIKLNDNNRNNQPNATNPQIASAYANNMYIVWQSKVGKSSNIFFKRSIDNSSSFQDTINLSDNLGNSSYPQVATSAGNVYVIWKNDNSNFGNQIFFKRSTDSGYSFGRKFSTVDISNTTASIGSPQIEADGRNVNIIWSEKNASNGNWQLWFTRSVNSGDFSGTIANTPKIVLSDATKTSDSPQIAVGYGNNTYQGNGVFAVWREHPNGSHNFSIYFRKGEEATK